LRIIDMVDEIAGGFALPSRAVYGRRDPADLDAADAGAARAAVEALRADHGLALFELSPERRGQLTPPWSS
jgi:hypothetical protein